eukprot:1756775-Prymnesium_polylepis.1
MKAPAPGMIESQKPDTCVSSATRLKGLASRDLGPGVSAAACARGVGGPIWRSPGPAFVRRWNVGAVYSASSGSDRPFPPARDGLAGWRVDTLDTALPASCAPFGPQ